MSLSLGVFCVKKSSWARTQRFLAFSSRPSFLVHVNGGAVRECDAVGGVEGFEVYLPVVADAQTDGNNSSKELKVLARKE